LVILLTSLVVELLASLLMLLRHLAKPPEPQSSEINITPVDRPSPTAVLGHPTTIPDNTISLLQQVKEDIATGELTRLSFRTLQRKYRIGPSMAQFIRQFLLREGLAIPDKTKLKLCTPG